MENGRAAEREIADIKGAGLERDAPLSRYTGFATGGPADFVVSPENPEIFYAVVAILRRHDQPFYILGNGSNLLALDDGYRGWLVRTEKAFGDIAFLPGGEVYCGAGVPLSRLCRACAEAGLSGLEFAYGVPGTVGGAIFMNAGAYDGEMKDVVRSVEVLDGGNQGIEIPADEMAFGYRTSAVKARGIIVTGARLRLKPGQKEAIRTRMEELVNRRRDKQPLEFPSCGSTFKRPAGGYASELIDRCGLRGFAIGGAAVSEKHCGFIINRGGATTADILALIAHVKQAVKEKTGILLEEEIQILG